MKIGGTVLIFLVGSCARGQVHSRDIDEFGLRVLREALNVVEIHS